MCSPSCNRGRGEEVKVRLWCMGLGLWTSARNYGLGEKTCKLMSYNCGVLRKEVLKALGCKQTFISNACMSLLILVVTWRD